MSFELFDVEFNSKVDMVPDNKKMEIYRWIKCYEDSCYENMRNSMDLEEVMDKIQNGYSNKKNKEDDK